MTDFSQQFPVVFGALNEGFLQTLKLFAVTLLGALPLGMLIYFGEASTWAPLAALGRRLSTKGKFSAAAKLLEGLCPIAAIIKFIIWVVRGTPLMLQLLVIYYFPGLVCNNPIWGSGTDGRFYASAAAFVFNYACYFAEIYRGGIQSIPKGQQEAGQVLGMTKQQIFFKITLLQMVKHILPPISNEIITLVKDTSLARVVALQEIIWMGEEFLKGSRGIAGAIWPLFFTGTYYLIFSGVLTAVLSRAERKLDFFKA